MPSLIVSFQIWAWSYSLTFHLFLLHFPVQSCRCGIRLPSGLSSVFENPSLFFLRIINWSRWEQSSDHLSFAPGVPGGPAFDLWKPSLQYSLKKTPFFFRQFSGTCWALMNRSRPPQRVPNFSPGALVV